MKNNYYVYVYIDPRNNEEFYYGKGKGSRKEAHLFDQSDSEKTKRILAIKKAGQQPIIRVIASSLTEEEALLIEKTLLWKLGKWTTNISSGHFSDKFRPHNTLHLELPGFDYQNGLYYYNVDEQHGRNWDDYCEFNFISAGGGPRWRDAIRQFKVGDVFVAYLIKRGFVGVGRIREEAKMVRDVIIDGKRLADLKLSSRSILDDANDAKYAEYASLVEWIKTVPRAKAKWRSKQKLFTAQHVRASLENQKRNNRFY